MKTIYLIGFMGSGKSTIGRLLAEKLQTSFMDTDHYIEEKYGLISNIFKNEGEKTFRSYEEDALKSTKEYDVVATGGGIVETASNFETMKNNGVIIYLQTSFQEIHQRLKDDQNRPLWSKGLEENKKLYKARISKYEKFCDWKIITDHKASEEVMKEILKKLNV